MDSLKEYSVREREEDIRKFWEKSKIFAFNSRLKKKIFSVDTPPPTVSGRMHLGHAFSYAQQDIIIRYKRMRGFNVFYPFGTDDNGLPTEKLVEKLKNVKSTEMSREEFIKLCEKTLQEIKPGFVNDWKIIGMSCDFNNAYSTIDKHSIKTSQKSFLDLFKKDLIYQHEAPSMWCVHCQTAIAQAELEDKKLESTFNDVVFHAGDKKIVIGTTRPELLAACVAIYVNPKDKKNEWLVGKSVTVPLFRQKVKVYADESADPSKGTGILMICSYGDKYDVEAVNKRKLEPRVVFTMDGRLNELAGKYKGLSIREARREILKDLEEEELLLNRKVINHVVNVHERCGTEIEFLSTKQWFVKLLENKKKFVDIGNKINWYPGSMKKRYEHWVKGLNWDWCISRQRHFGVPFPVWYCVRCKTVLVADEKDLPLDPLAVRPKKSCSCGSSEFYGETDVMDTWATSSVTPEIILDWAGDFGVDFKKMHPMSVRPQAHDIIRTWAFYTIVKSVYHHNKVPWWDIIISGHVLDPKGESMHKSKGNAVEPADAINKYGADALRFWAAGSKLGEDLRYLEKDLLTGHKTVTKLWNASKFSFMHLKDYKKRAVLLEPFDMWLLIKLDSLVKECTSAFENYEYSLAKNNVENFFWNTFCDNYLEIIKKRVYNGTKNERESAQYTLYVSLLTIIKLFAPIMPYITEWIYQAYFKKFDGGESVHVSSWPEKSLKKVDKKLEKEGDAFVKMISLARKFKSENHLHLKTEVNLTILGKYKNSKFLDDFKAVTNASETGFGKTFRVCENGK